ncbi:MAG: hypothetical protein JWN89_314 [Parcubacteria group bacterium]|nr:hypothetical protein [Parcubacteria group bacterium]
MATTPRPARPRSARPAPAAPSAAPASTAAQAAPAPAQTFWEKTQENIGKHQGRLITGTLAAIIFLLILFFSWPNVLGYLKPSWYVWLIALAAAIFILWPADEKTWTGLVIGAFVILLISNIGSKAMEHSKEVEAVEVAKQAAYLRLHPLPPPTPERDSVGFYAKKGEFTRPWRVPSKYAGYDLAIWPSDLNDTVVVKTDVKTDSIRPNHDAEFGKSRIYAFNPIGKDQLITVYLCKTRC